MKPCVKGHHSLVLRAETAAEKYSWLARLRYASDGSSKNQPIKKYESKDILAQKSDASKADAKGDSRRATRDEGPSRVGHHEIHGSHTIINTHCLLHNNNLQPR